jgi:mRNA-degrading endonuclease toxin of MazEF toxin-antitoxin module
MAFVLARFAGADAADFLQACQHIRWGKDPPMEFRRGDVVLIAFPFIQDFSKSKERPAVIIQNDVGNAYGGNLILAAITSHLPEQEYPVHYRVYAGTPIAKEAGLDRDSIVKAETIITVPKSSVIEKLGHFTPEALAEIDRCLRVSLELE